MKKDDDSKQRTDPSPYLRIMQRIEKKVRTLFDLVVPVCVLCNGRLLFVNHRLVYSLFLFD